MTWVFSLLIAIGFGGEHPGDQHRDIFTGADVALFNPMQGRFVHAGIPGDILQTEVVFFAVGFQQLADDRFQ